MLDCSEATGECTDLCGIRVSDPFLVNPVSRLLVLRVVNFLGRVNGWFEVLKEAASLVALAIEENIVSVVRAITRYCEI